MAYGTVMPDEQITNLEIQLAHQARLLEELDEVVRTQADELTVLQRQMRAVIARVVEAEEASPGAVVLGDQKPPHY